jgi:hypothetical protein
MTGGMYAFIPGEDGCENQIMKLDSSKVTDGFSIILVNANRHVEKEVQVRSGESYEA